MRQAFIGAGWFQVEATEKFLYRSIVEVPEERTYYEIDKGVSVYPVYAPNGQVFWVDRITNCIVNDNIHDIVQWVNSHSLDQIIEHKTNLLVKMEGHAIHLDEVTFWENLGCRAPTREELKFLRTDHDMLAAVQKTLYEERRRSKIFEDCMFRALKIYRDIHPEDETWPSADRNFAFILDQYEKLRSGELVDALVRVSNAASVIFNVTSTAWRRDGSQVTCPHGNAPSYPTHAWWCDKCWNGLRDALEAVRDLTKMIERPAEDISDSDFLRDGGMIGGIDQYGSVE